MKTFLLMYQFDARGQVGVVTSDSQASKGQTSPHAPEGEGGDWDARVGGRLQIIGQSSFSVI